MIEQYCCAIQINGKMMGSFQASTDDDVSKVILLATKASCVQEEIKKGSIENIAIKNDLYIKNKVLMVRFLIKKQQASQLKIKRVLLDLSFSIEDVYDPFESPQPCYVVRNNTPGFEANVTTKLERTLLDDEAKSAEERTKILVEFYFKMLKEKGLTHEI